MHTSSIASTLKIEVLHPQLEWYPSGDPNRESLVGKKYSGAAKPSTSANHRESGTGKEGGWGRKPEKAGGGGGGTGSGEAELMAGM
jgi:hypothetical protein